MPRHMGPRYRLTLKRRRLHLTDYRQRAALLKSGLPRLVVRPSNRYIYIQFVEAQPEGDYTKMAVFSKILAKYNWPLSFKCVPAAYLTGLIAGLKAEKVGIKKAVLDIGLVRPTKGNRVFAALYGVVKAGIEVPHSPAILPDENRIYGEHINSYINELYSMPDFDGVQFCLVKKKLGRKKIPTLIRKIEKEILKRFGGENRNV